MSLWTIAWRSLQQRGLASTLTALSMALGVTLVVAVLVIETVVERSFQTNSSLGYNMIVGGKGGKLQLVLNTMFHLDKVDHNIPYWYYKEFLPKEKRGDDKDGKFAKWVDAAIPVCSGDYFENYRVIATTPQMFEEPYAENKHYEFSAGRNFKTDEVFTGIIGEEVARRTGLTVGGEFQPSHGIPGGHKHDPFKVVGVLARTGTPNDRGVFINIEGFYLLEHHALPSNLQMKAPGQADHDHEHADHDHDHADHDHDKAKPAAADKDHAHEKDADHDHDHDKEKAGAADKDHPADKKDADHDHDHEKEKAGAADKDHPADKKDADHDHDHDHAKQAATKPAGAAKHDHEHMDADHDHDEHDHDHEHGHVHKPLPESEREVSAVLIRTKAVNGALPELVAMDMAKPIDHTDFAIAAMPVSVITEFFNIFVRPIQILLLSLTVMIVIVSGIGILVSIYNSMSDRKHEIAVMRALGASRGTVMWIVLLESILLSLGGGLIGWLLGHGLISVLSPWLLDTTGVTLGFFHFTIYELILIPALVALASLVGYLPALTAYRTDVARALSATP